MKSLQPATISPISTNFCKLIVIILPNETTKKNKTSLPLVFKPSLQNSKNNILSENSKHRTYLFWHKCDS